MLVDLKIAIIRSGKTQRTIAKETGVPEVRLSEIVRGAVRPHATERATIAAAIQASPDIFDCPNETRSAR